MSAIFDGIGDYLVVNDPLIGATPSWPVMIRAYFKPVDTITFGPIVGISDNAALAGLDLLWFYAGTTALLQADAWATGASISASASGNYSAGAWQQGFVYRPDANFLHVKLGGGGWITSTGATPTAGLTHAAIGTGMVAGAPNGFFKGRLADIVIASAFAPGNATRDAIAAAFLANTRPTEIPELSGCIDAYMPLVGNEIASVGPAWTNNGAGFDASDNPVTYPEGSASRAWVHIAAARGMRGGRGR